MAHNSCFWVQKFVKRESILKSFSILKNAMQDAFLEDFMYYLTKF